MATPILVTPSLLKQVIKYEPDTGRFFFLPRPDYMFGNAGSAFLWNNDNAGKQIISDGKPMKYKYISVFGENLGAHRIAWAISHGQWPEGEIDHKNGIPGDNRLLNLRDVTPSLNQRNRVISANNTSGHIGVMASKHKWIAFILDKHIGTFDTLEEAIIARKEAETNAGGFTDRNGKRQIRQAKRISRHIRRYI